MTQSAVKVVRDREDGRQRDREGACECERRGGKQPRVQSRRATREVQQASRQQQQRRRLPSRLFPQGWRDSVSPVAVARLPVCAVAPLSSPAFLAMSASAVAVSLLAMLPRLLVPAARKRGRKAPWAVVSCAGCRCLRRCLRIPSRISPAERNVSASGFLSSEGGTLEWERRQACGVEAEPMPFPFRSRDITLSLQAG